MTPRRPMVAGNWKMNGSRVAARALVRSIARDAAELASVDVVVCPPAILIPEVAAELGHPAPVAWGAQDVNPAASGAYTGETSIAMLKDFGCRYVILGHSERRALFGETDPAVAAKTAAALGAGLTPIVCVGESLFEREAGQTEDVVGRQLQAVIEAVVADALAGAVLAYEPVWAIGTGKTASPEQAQTVHGFLREQVARADPRVAEVVRILYGGSVKPDNARALFAQPDIDGGLIGGASLQADAFVAICRAATQDI